MKLLQVVNNGGCSLDAAAEAVLSELGGIFTITE